jgi:hypothetical protein
MSDLVNKLLGLLQLAKRSREAQSVESLAFVMVNETKQVLHYRQAAFWLENGHIEGLGSVAAVSGLPTTNPGAPYIQWLSKLFKAILKLEGIESPKTISASDLPDVSEEWIEWLPEHVLWIPLKLRDGPLTTGLLLADTDKWNDQDLAVSQELSGSYAQSLRQLQFNRSRVSLLKAALGKIKNRRWVWITLFLIAIFPVEQSVLAAAEVVPSEPFLVRAPQDGVIGQMMVTPNQAVSRDTPLFTLDQTALQTRLALARQALVTAEEEYRQSAQTAVTEDKAKLEMSIKRGALGEKELELAYVGELLGRVQVKSEKSGIAVFSDVNDLQGKTVQMGERVLTVADPSKVELNILVPVGERFDMKVGDPVTLYPNASPLTAFNAVVSQVPYSAETSRDGQVVFKLKATFLELEPKLRIGLVGTAKLHGTRTPLAFYAMRRPLTSLRQWLGV